MRRPGLVITCLAVGQMLRPAPSQKKPSPDMVLRPSRVAPVHGTGHSDRSNASACADTGSRLRSPPRARSFRLSLGAWLALGLMAIMVVCLTGNVLVQRSTRLATQNAARVQEELEPLAHRARTLADAIGGFDRDGSHLPEAGLASGSRGYRECARSTCRTPRGAPQAPAATAQRRSARGPVHMLLERARAHGRRIDGSVRSPRRTARLLLVTHGCAGAACRLRWREWPACGREHDGAPLAFGAETGARCRSR